MDFELASNLHAAARMHIAGDSAALFNGARGDVYVAQHIIVLGAFVGDYLPDTSSANNQDIFFHFSIKPSLRKGEQSGEPRQ
jgi:hypothetical protein